MVEPAVSKKDSMESASSLHAVGVCIESASSLRRVCIESEVRLHGSCIESARSLHRVSIKSARSLLSLHRVYIESGMSA